MISYDADGVALELQSRQTRLARLARILARHPDRIIDHDEHLSFALAELRATAEEAGDEVDIGGSRIRMTHRTLSRLSSVTAEALGLPPLVKLTLRTDVSGVIGTPEFRLTYEWVRAGRREQVKRTGAIIETSGGRRRLPRVMLEALDVADRFQSGADFDEHWNALARFRRALEPGAPMNGADAEARVSMTDFLSELEVTLADRFSISPRDGDQFDIIPFSGEVVDGAERDGLVSETAAELQGGRLRTFQDRVSTRGPRPAYKVGAHSYLIVDPSAAPVLRVMTDMQRADPVTRAAFIRNPRQPITEAVTEHLRAKGKLNGLSPVEEQELIEQAADPAFVETAEYAEYSDRVIGITIYERPTIDIPGAVTTWLPEAFTGNAVRVVDAMPPEALADLIARVDAAIAVGADTVEVGGHEIPASAATRIALEQRLGQLSGSEIGPDRPAGFEPAATGRTGPIILDTTDNIEEVRWAARIRPRVRLVDDALPAVIQADLKGHQTDSFRWKLDAWQAGLPGVLNADEQGLGKTLQAIAFLAWMKENMSRAEGGRPGPVLVVAPTSLLENWELEVDKHLRAPALGNVIRLYGSALGGKKKPGTQGVETESGHALLDLSDLHEAIAEGRGHRYWVLTTYTTLTNYQHSLAKIPFSTAVFDEIQAVKNPANLRAKAALAVNADFRIGLTGTPIENSTIDIWAIMEQITPGRFGSLADFRDRFGTPAEQNMRALHALLFTPQNGLPPVALRRLKEEVARDLPEKARRIHPRLMPAPQAAAYEKARCELASGSRGAALKMLHHIRSVSMHPNAAPAAEDNAYVAMSARLQAAMDILRDVRSRGERALVFIEHVQMQHRFIELLKREFRLSRVDLINGNTPIPRRQEIVNRFQRHLARDEGFEVLVLGPKAGGTGLTLTAATHVIHLSRWWNPALEEQCNDRIHRIGQTRPVTVHVPMAIHPDYQHNSFDCLLHSLMIRKRRLASAALWPMGDTEDDASALQQMLAGEGAILTTDPVRAAMATMFQRDEIALPPTNPDGSIPYK